MIEDEIEHAKMESDLIDISDSPDFVKDVKNGNLVFYKGEKNYYLNFASVVIAKKYRGKEGGEYFEKQEKDIKRNKAKKLDETKSMELLRKMQAEKNYRYQYFV